MNGSVMTYADWMVCGGSKVNGTFHEQTVPWVTEKYEEGKQLERNFLIVLADTQGLENGLQMRFEAMYFDETPKIDELFVKMKENVYLCVYALIDLNIAMGKQVTARTIEAGR